MTTPHIAIDARAINSTTGTVLRNLLPQIEEQNSETRYTVIVNQGDETCWVPISHNFTILTVRAATWSLSTQYRMLATLRSLKPDLVWFFMPEQPVLYWGCKITTFFDLTMLKAPTNKVRWRWRSYLKLPFAKLIYRHAARTSERLIVSARVTQSEIIHRYGIDSRRFALVHCGVKVSPGGTEPYSHPFDQFLLYVGQHGWHKDLLRLCDAHQLLLQEFPRLGLLFVGKIDRQAGITKKYVEKSGYKNIVFTGFLPDAQRDWLYRDAQAYVFPSLHEGFGLPGLEAMGFGTAVISSDATCLPEIYGDAAAFFRAGNTEDLVRTIRRVLMDSDLRKTLSRRGIDRYNMYSYKRMASEMIALFSETIACCKGVTLRR